MSTETTTRTGRTFGYARVSTRKQKENGQLNALLEQGIARRNIFLDKQSGKNLGR